MTNVDDDRRWLHCDADLISGHGVSYHVQYLGSIEILCSMKTLDFENRTRVARDSIRAVCTAVGIGLKDRRKPDISSMLSTEPNLIHSGTGVLLTISTDALMLKRLTDLQILCSHKMEGISFASAGEHETKDYIAYVAKDNLNKRSCHVLSCKENESLDVITTIGQAFELRYNEYMQNHQSNDPPAESTTHRPISNNPIEELWSNATMPDVYKEKWFHGKIGRDEAELLLHHSGDFLVRESVKVPGQFILSGRYKDQFKHLLLIDPEGIIRTKDYEFDSIQHLISYHRSGNIPIVSADSELLLQTAVLRTK